ncbi:MAG: hypothetical protein ACYTFY_20100, partial [Planctomycetota bacterium]
MKTSIRKAILRRCEFDINKGRYTTGEMDPDMTAFIVELCTDEQQGFGECIPTSIIYPEGH